VDITTPMANVGDIHFGKVAASGHVEKTST
jgi:hypothetical protein